MVLESELNFYKWENSHLLTISGKDSTEFLQRLSTQNFKENKSVFHGAFLTGQARVIGIFTAWATALDSFLFFIEPSMFKNVCDYLNKMHFAEDLSMTIEQKTIYEIRTSDKHLHLSNSIPAYNWGLAGFYSFEKPAPTFLELNTLEWNCLRAKYGFPQFDIDLTSDHILIEAPLDNLVHRNKGCYPGQEVIEKIYTYGRASQKILKIQFDKEPKISLPFTLYNDQKEKFGVITSVYCIRNRYFGLATLKRMQYEKTNTFEFLNSDTKVSATIV